MSLRFRCPCGQKLKTADNTVGKRAKCAQCHRWVRIPESDSYDTIAREIEPKKPRRVPDEDESSEPSGTIKRDAGKDSKARVVIADSDRENLKTLSDLLVDHGYTVVETNDGIKAVTLIRNDPPDAILLDVQLDNLGGFQVVKQVRELSNPLNKEVWQIPVLMTTSKLRGRDKQYAMSIGVQGFFDKPLNPAKVCHKLEKEIERYRSHHT